MRPRVWLVREDREDREDTGEAGLLSWSSDRDWAPHNSLRMRRLPTLAAMVRVTAGGCWGHGSGWRRSVVRGQRSV